MKIRHWIGALTVSICTVAYADHQPKTTPPNTEQGAFTRGMPREVTPAAGPRIAHGANIFITADFIFWKAAQDGLNYATSGIVNNVGTLLTKRGDVHSPDFGFDPGFKVGLGVNLPYDGWDVYAQYTWLHSNSNGDRVQNSDGNIQQNVLLGSLDDQISSLGTITSARSSWDLHFNVIDIELGRSYYLSRNLVLRPFAGLKWTWQDQDWRARYAANSVTANGSSPANSGEVKMNQDQDLWGVGVRTGLNTSWYFSESWSLFVNGAFSAVWTDYDVDRSDTFQPVNQTATSIVRTHESAYYVRSVAEFQLGITGEWWFSDNNYHFAVSAAYEQQVWLNYGNFIYLIDKSGGDLSLHGLTVNFRFDF